MNHIFFKIQTHACAQQLHKRRKGTQALLEIIQSIHCSKSSYLVAFEPTFQMLTGRNVNRRQMFVMAQRLIDMTVRYSIIGTVVKCSTNFVQLDVKILLACVRHQYLHQGIKRP